MGRGFVSSSACRLSAAVLGATCVVTAAQAHEAGTTRVLATFTADDRYTIEVSADAGAVLARLEVATHQPRSTPADLTDYQRGYERLCAEIPKHLAVMFDGVRSTPDISCVVDAADPRAPDGFSVPGLTATLRGTNPRGARRFAWHYGLTFTSYSLTVKAGDSSAGQSDDKTIWLEGEQETMPLVMTRVAVPSPRLDVARRYFTLGLTHVLPTGAEHLLFVLGIFLFSRRLRPTLIQMAAFTAAYSLALGLALNGVVSLPKPVVELVVAVSIVCVALVNLAAPDRNRWRLFLIAGFGFFHGLSLAAAFRLLPVPRLELWTGWASFNAGLEAGFIGVFIVAYCIIGSRTRGHDAYYRFVVLPGSAAMALTGLFWTMEQLIAG